MTLYCGEDVCQTISHREGATYCLTGSTDCSLNITGNYTAVWNIHDALDGLTGRESLPILKEKIDELGYEPDDNYWAPTPGNVGYACLILASWAKQHPDAVWRYEP